MKRIYKYPLEVTDTQIIELPFGARILTADMQYEKLCLWALVNPDLESKSKRTIDIFGTGHPIDGKPRDYISTFQMDGGRLIFHVFVRTRSSPCHH